MRKSRHHHRYARHITMSRETEGRLKIRGAPAVGRRKIQLVLQDRRRTFIDFSIAKLEMGERERDSCASSLFNYAKTGLFSLPVVSRRSGFAGTAIRRQVLYLALCFYPGDDNPLEFLRTGRSIFSRNLCYSGCLVLLGP
jgi:hypothetical protein